jgi:hypothetical protein
MGGKEGLRGTWMPKNIFVKASREPSGLQKQVPNQQFKTPVYQHVAFEPLSHPK